MRARFVAGNWKMNGSLRANAELLAALKSGLARSENVAYAVCAPFPYLPQVSAALAGSAIAWGAQDVCEHELGAYTGEVSGAMLKEFGCRYAIVGHSERRSLYGEEDARVAAKFVVTRRSGLTPILCVGETLMEHERGDTEKVVARQLDAVIGAAGPAALASAVLAYEPVWAIGTGRNATPQQAQQVHAFLRASLASQGGPIAENLTILYGGSVKVGNAKELFAMPDIDGGLIGGASLVAEDFIAICRAARREPA
jgi:triosephosphate isomerase